MGCTGAGLVAICVLFAGVVLNIVSFILPLWSTSTVVNKSLSDSVNAVDFTAGVWGYCTDVVLTSLESNANVSFNHCYLFHTSTDVDLSDIDVSLARNFSDLSICNGYTTASKTNNQSEYTTELATLAGLDAEQFELFVDKSCSALGSATLSFAVISMSTGVFAFILLLLGIMCCKTKSAIIAIGKYVTIIALLSTVLTFFLWLAQIHPLGKKDDVNLAGSFILSVLSGFLYLITILLVARHAALY